MCSIIFSGGGRGAPRGGRGGGRGGFGGRGGGRGGMRGGRKTVIEPHRHEGERLLLLVTELL